MTPSVTFASYHQSCDLEEFQACVASVTVGGHRLAVISSDCISYRDGRVKLWSNVRCAIHRFWWLSDPFRSCIKSSS